MDTTSQNPWARFEGKNAQIKLAADAPELGAKAGQVITLALTPQDVHDPTELPTYLAGYKPFPYRADEFSKIVLVDHDEDKTRCFHSDDAFRRVNVKSSVQGPVNEVDTKSSLTSFRVVDRFIGAFISDITEQNATMALRPRQAAMRRCQRAIMLDREIDMWGLVSDYTKWTDSSYYTTLTAGQNWNAGTKSDPIQDLEARLIASAQPVTDICMNEQNAFSFLRHPLVKDRMRQMLGDNPAGQSFAKMGESGSLRDFQIPGLPPIHVIGAKVKNETTGALEYVLGDFIVCLCAPPGVPTTARKWRPPTRCADAASLAWATRPASFASRIAAPRVARWLSRQWPTLRS